MFLRAQKTPGQSLLEVKLLSNRKTKQKKPKTKQEKNLCNFPMEKFLPKSKSFIRGWGRKRSSNYLANITKIMIKDLTLTFFNITEKNQINVRGFFS